MKNILYLLTSCIKKDIENIQSELCIFNLSTYQHP